MEKEQTDTKNNRVASALISRYNIFDRQPDSELVQIVRKYLI